MASRKHKRWSPREEAFIAKNYEFALAAGVGSEARDAMCRTLDRTWNAVMVHYSHMGCGKAGTHWTNEERALLRDQLAAAARGTGKTADECLAELLRLRRRVRTDARNGW